MFVTVAQSPPARQSVQIKRCVVQGRAFGSSQRLKASENCEQIYCHVLMKKLTFRTIHS